ncbi:MAG: RNA polymerase sigma factor [Nannocystales bacterium]
MNAEAIQEPAPRRDEQAFEALFQQYYRWAVRNVCALGIARGDAEDVAQEVFVVAYRRWAELPLDAHEPGWLFGVVRRVCANHRRARQRAGERLKYADGPAEAMDPDAALDQRAAAMLLQTFLEQLPEPQRLAFVLYDINGMKAPQAGTVLGISANTVHSRVRQARDKLDRLIANHKARQKRGLRNG